MFFTKPKLKFECILPGVSTVMPIIPAKQIKHQWVGRAHAELAQMRKDASWGTEKVLHTARCPGIFKLMRAGFVLRTWQDIVIETNGDGSTFTWETPIDQKQLNVKAGDYVSSHGPHQLYNYLDTWPVNTLNSVIKIQSGWQCFVPKGYNLLEMALPYSDEGRFTTVQGFYNNDYGLATLNPQLLWHVQEGRTLIKAGTPIAQYLLVPVEQPEFEVYESVPCSNSDMHGVVTNNRFIKNFAEIRKIFRGL